MDLRKESTERLIVLRDLIYGTQIAKPKDNALNDGAIVLEEEEYTRNLEAIIRRDYFPSLAKLEAYKDYEARKSRGEDVRIPTILVKRTPLANAKEVPVETQSARESEIDVSNMTLDEYLHKYTSEDNRSFEKLFEKQKEEERKKYAWMEKQAESANARVLALQQANASAVKSIEWDREKHMKPDAQFALCEAKSSLFFGPKV
eukprot:TRINITY_DN1416_c0_g3_i1.p3 TRINITY_DN1416_c0_g3~~TRINITY_DN1416_c0_g3_i1.p3  ORF type:complete len:203 (+),score=76.93 TRINITY_DN1416_c0_g3_i1:196-804(+)